MKKYLRKYLKNYSFKKYRMFRFTTITLIFFLSYSSTFAEKPKKVLATASMIADMAQQIAGDKIVIDCIVPIGGDPHLYDPVPSDARMAAAADLILKNGLTFEGWLQELMDNSGTNAKQVLVTEGVEAIESQTYANSADPHAWMNVANGIIYAENIYKAIVDLDPDNTSYYTENYTAYRAKLEYLDQYITDRIQSIPTQNRVLITSHDAFQYYGRKYGIQLEAILGTSTDAEEQTSDIIRVNKVIRERKIPAVFIESTVNPKLLKQIASDNDVVIGGSLYADSIGDKDSPAPTYYDMLKYNTETIVSALSQVKASTNKGSEEGASNFIWFIVAAMVLLGLLLLVAKFIKN